MIAQYEWQQITWVDPGDLKYLKKKTNQSKRLIVELLNAYITFLSLHDNSFWFQKLHNSNTKRTSCVQNTPLKH